MNKSDITIAICTRNRAEHLRRCLDGLKAQLDKGSAVTVSIIDNASTDFTAQVVENASDHLNTKYFLESRVGLSHARNLAVNYCDTEYIVFLDDDAIPMETWLEAIYEGVRKYNPDIFGGPYIPFYLSKKPDWYSDEFGSAHHFDNEGEVSQNYCFSGGNMGWRVSLLRKYGGFDPELGMVDNTLRLGEETALQIKMWQDSSIVRALLPKMLMRHLVSPEKMTIKYIAKRSYTYGRQLHMIDPDSPLITQGMLKILKECRFFLPVLVKPFLRDREKFRYYKTYLGYYLSLHCMSLGAWYSRNVTNK